MDIMMFQSLVEIVYVLESWTFSPRQNFGVIWYIKMLKKYYLYCAYLLTCLFIGSQTQRSKTLSFLEHHLFLYHFCQSLYVIPVSNPLVLTLGHMYFGMMQHDYTQLGQHSSGRLINHNFYCVIRQTCALMQILLRRTQI